MCEVLPAIDERTPSPDSNGVDSAKLEQLMISMLEERDKLVEKLRESQEIYTEATRKLALVEADNNVLMRQLQAFMPYDEKRLQTMLDALRKSGGISNSDPDDYKRWPVAKKFAQLARECAASKETISEKDEEIEELKAERTNTRLLLEHLECLVARHEKSLRMTVVKRQTSSAGVSSEVEVLKALKSLFDHHKALDEKVRERLRTAQERIIVLEDELMVTNQEMKVLQDGNKRMKKLIQQRNSIRMSVNFENVNFSKEQLAMIEEREQVIGDLQFSLDERGAQLEEAIHQRDEVEERAQELEEELGMTVVDLKKCKAAQKSMSEAVAVSSSLEEELAELKKKMSDSDHQLSSLTEQNELLSNQVSSVEAKLAKVNEEAVSVKTELERKEQSLQDIRGQNEELLWKQTEKVTQADSAESQIQLLQSQLQANIQESTVTHEKERVSEGHVTQLQQTVDRMLKESRDRMETHANERRQLSEEKSGLIEKVVSLERKLQDSRKENLNLQNRFDQLQNRFEQLSKRQLSSPMLGRAKQLRNSWAETNVDDAILTATSTNQMKTEEQTPAAVAGDSLEEHGVSDLAEPEAVSKLISIIESQVNVLDKQLETMGEGVEEANEFDRKIREVTEGNFHPSTATALETFPRSSPPLTRVSKRKYKPESLPSSRYRVNLTNSDLHAPTQLPATGAAEASSPKLKLFQKSFKLFRKKSGSSKKHQSRRSSAPVPQLVRDIVRSEQARESVDFSDLLEASEDREAERERKGQLLTKVLTEGLPFSQWRGSTVVAWLEVWVGVPYWYIAALRNCVSSGAILANLSQTELEQELGITNSLHRVKLRLAVMEITSLTSSAKPHRSTSLYGEMGHEWIGDYWLPSLGLSQYKEVFKACLVDARMLEHLTKKDLRTVLKMVDTAHRNSLQYGISVLKKLDYNRAELEQRREKISVANHKDVLVWTSDHVTQWAGSVGLGDHTPCLKDRGVHGGVIALDHDFDTDKMALALQISPTDFELCRLLKVEFGKLLSEGTKRSNSESQSHGKIVRKLSKKLKVGSRAKASSSSSSSSSSQLGGGNAEFIAVRPSSPVLYSARPTPLHLHSLLEESDSNASSHSTAPPSSNSVENRLGDFHPDTPTERTV